MNCVKWLSTRGRRVQTFQNPCAKEEKGDNQPLVEIVSGSVDNTVILWQGKGTNLVPVQTLKLHSGAVTCLAATYLPHLSVVCEGKDADVSTATLVASGSADSSVVIWERTNSDGEKSDYVLVGVTMIGS